MTLAYIAAGTLEDLLGYHGEAFIERVENLPRRFSLSFGIGSRLRTKSL
jgi:hypothetical protein